MRRTKIIQILFVLFSICLLPLKMTGVNIYNIVVQQPDSIVCPVIKWSTVSMDNKNQIFWQNQQNENIASNNIYRKSTDSISDWELAGEVEYDSEPFFTDVNSTATNQSYLFKVAAVDKCGNEYFSNNLIQSIFLQYKAVIDGCGYLEWNAPEGLNVINYRVYRGATASELILIDSVGSSVTTYIDKDVNSVGFYYQIESQCLEPETKNSLSIKSNNIAVSDGLSNSFSSIYNKNLHIYPNPLLSVSVVKFPFDPTQHYKMTVRDLAGKIVFEQQVSSGEFQIQRKLFNVGVYLLQIIGDRSICEKLIVGGNLE